MYFIKKEKLKKYFVLTMILLSFCLIASACSNIDFKLEFVVNDEVYQTVTTSGEGAVVMPKNPPEPDGYTFEGWFWDKDVWSKPFTANSLLDEPLKSNMRVYAYFSKQLAGTEIQLKDFVLSEGVYRLSVASATTSIAISDYLKTNPTSTIVLARDANFSETVTGILTLNTGSNELFIRVTDKLSQSKDYKLSIYKKNQFTVKFITGNETEVSPVKVEEGEAYAPQAPKREGFAFLKWDYDFSKLITADLTATASWREFNYTIRFDKNGGLGTIADIPTAYTNEVTLPKCSFTKEGFVFRGWKMGERTIADGEKVVKLSNIDDGVATLTAIWEVKPELVGTEAEFDKIFEKQTSGASDVYFCKTANSVASFDFKGKVKIANNATYTVSKDALANDVIQSKVVSLQTGDNIFYVCVSDGKDGFQAYKTNVRRRMMYLVNFVTNCEATINSLSVEEDGFVDINNVTKDVVLEKTGYTVVGWDVDFTKPITRATTATLGWAAKTYTYNFEFRNNIISIPALVKEYSAAGFNICEYLSAAILAYQQATFPNFVNNTIMYAYYYGDATYNNISGCFKASNIALPTENLTFYCDIGTENFSSVNGKFRYVENDSVTSLGGVVVPYGFTSLEGSTAYRTDALSLKEIHLPSSLTNINRYCFFKVYTKIVYSKECNMTYTKNKLSFPRSIKTIEAYAFNDSGSIVYSSINRGYLIYIPYEVESIGAYAFGKDNNEPTIDCERSDGFYKSTIWNWNAVITRSDNTTDFIPTSYGVSKKSTADFEYIECADGVALIKYIGASTNVVIPEMIEGKKVIDFNGCFTNNITIKSVEILAKVARLNGFEFKGCSNLTTVIFPEGHSIKDLGYKTFKDTAIKTFVVPANVELINNAFAGAKSLEFVSFAGNKLISSGNFADCTALKGIRYPDSLKTLNKGAFANCTNLVAVYLPASLEKVEMDDESNYTCGAFRGLSKVTIVYNTLPNQSNFHKNWDTYQWNGVNVSGKGTVCKKKTGTSVVYLEGKMYYVDMTGQNILLG